MAGLIKAIMVLEKGVIPPNTNFEKVNSKIDTAFLRIKVSTTRALGPYLDTPSLVHRFEAIAEVETLDG